jgi:hypothetical protein
MMDDKDQQLRMMVEANQVFKDMFHMTMDQEGPFERSIMNMQLGLCPSCGNKARGFRTKFAYREYLSSGLCQGCQDWMFKGGHLYCDN